MVLQGAELSGRASLVAFERSLLLQLDRTTCTGPINSRWGRQQALAERAPLQAPRGVQGASEHLRHVGAYCRQAIAAKAARW